MQCLRTSRGGERTICEPRHEARDTSLLQNIQTGSAANPVCSSMFTGEELISEAKTAGVVKLISPPRAEINERSYSPAQPPSQWVPGIKQPSNNTSIPPSCLQVCRGTTSPHDENKVMFIVLTRSEQWGISRRNCQTIHRVRKRLYPFFYFFF